jgi:hypothetical protein
MLSVFVWSSWPIRLIIADSVYQYIILTWLIPGKNLVPTEGLLDEVVRSRVEAAQDAQLVRVGRHLLHVTVGISPDGQIVRFNQWRRPEPQGIGREGGIGRKGEREARTDGRNEGMMQAGSEGGRKRGSDGGREGGRYGLREEERGVRRKFGIMVTIDIDPVWCGQHSK